MLEHADLEDAFLGGAKAPGADFTGARLESATLQEGDFTRAQFQDANLQGARAGGARFGGAAFLQADLRRIDLTGADLRQANLSGAVLDGATATGAKIAGMVPTGRAATELKAQWLDNTPDGSGGARVPEAEAADWLTLGGGAGRRPGASGGTSAGGTSCATPPWSCPTGCGWRSTACFRTARCDCDRAPSWWWDRAGCSPTAESSGAGDITIQGQFFERNSPGNRRASTAGRGRPGGHRGLDRTGAGADPVCV